MALKFPCRECGKEIIVKFLKVGEPAKCPHCGFENIVPADAKITDEVRDYSKEQVPLRTSADTKLSSVGQRQETKLGPHTLGSVFSGIFSIYGNCFLPMIGIVFIVFVMSAVPNVIFVVIMISSFAARSGPPGHFFSIFMLYMVPILVLTILLQTLEQAVISYLTFDQYSEKAILKKAWNGIKGRFWRIVGANLLAGLVVLGLALTIIGIPFAIYYSGYWRFMTQAIIVEDCGVMESLTRSKELVTDHWWRLFGITMAIALCFLFVYIIVSFIPFVNLIVSMVVSPLPMIANTLLYLDVRVRKEGYNEEALKRDISR